MSDPKPPPTNASVAALKKSRRSSARFSTQGLGALIKQQASESILVPTQVPKERAERFRQVLQREVVNASSRDVPRYQVMVAGRFGKETPARLFLAPEGVAMVDADDDSKIQFFHGWTFIKSFLVPKKGNAMAGYLLPYSDEELNFVFRFASSDMAVDFSDNCRTMGYSFADNAQASLTPRGSHKLVDGRAVNSSFSDLFTTNAETSLNAECL